MTVAVVSIGFGDSIPCNAYAKDLSMYFQNQPLKILGTVSMDVSTIDITDIENKPKIGDSIEVIGSNQTSIRQ